ncbi:MAG TPA: hypothetical protein VGB64_00960 [Actinomycetota bacterium]
MRRIAALTIMTGGFLLLLAGAALADNCDLRINPGDCQNTAWTVGTIATVAAAGAGAAAAAGALNGKPDEEPPPEKPDPCAAEEGRLEAARYESRLINAALQDFRGLMNMLETMYEDTRQASYLSGVVDVGFIAGSVWGKPAGAAAGALGWAGKAAAEKLIGNALLAAGIKGVTKEMVKDAIRSMEDMDIKVEDLAAKPLKDAAKKAFTQKLGEYIANKKMGEFLKNGLRASDFRGVTFSVRYAGAFEKIRDSVTKNYAQPLADFVGNAMSLYSMGESAWSGAKKLEAIRGEMSRVRQQTFDLESRFEDALFELDLANDSLRHCREYNPIKAVAK